MDRGVFFGHFTEVCGAFGDLRECGVWLPAAGHRRVEVDFLEPGLDMAFDQLAGFFHRHVERFVFPDVRPKVITAKDLLIHRHACLIGHAAQPRHEI